jgi:hypothetical protein
MLMAGLQNPGSSKKRPTSMTVLGIIGIIICSLGILGSLWGFIGLAVINGILQTAPGMPGTSAEGQILLLRLSAFLELIFPFVLTAFSLSLTVHACGLTASLGILSDKKWGRLMGFAFVGLSFLSTVVMVIITFSFADRFVEIFRSNFHEIKLIATRYDEMPLHINVLFLSLGFTGKLTAVINALFGNVYPVLLLVFLNTQNTKEHFRGLS